MTSTRVSERRVAEQRVSERRVAERRVAEPLPIGFRIVLHDDTREVRPALWHGGSPARVLRLNRTAQRALDDLRRGPVHDRTTGLVARRFVEAGLAHPTPGSRPHLARADVTVVIPVLDRAAELDRCLTSLGTGSPVVVVDDGSSDELAIRAAAHRHGARVVRLEVNAGPAAARAAGLAHVHTHYVAFVDSDTEPGGTWIEDLAPHLADPAVAALAPRIVSAGDDATTAHSYSRARSSLDLGPRPAEVRPYGRVAYVPTAALLARVAALHEVGGFDPALRVGEDVDLVWRLTAAGHRVRYVPDVRVRHHEPATWPALLHRRFRYGRSAAPLARRHPRQLAPMIVHPWFAGTVAAALAGRPRAAALGLAGTVLAAHRALTAADLPAGEVPRQVAGGLLQTWQSAGRYARQFALPVVLAAAARGGRRTTLAAVALLVAPAVADHRARRAPVAPLVLAAGAIADDAAYGAGVLAGCLAERTSAPLRPLRAARTRPARPS